MKRTQLRIFSDDNDLTEAAARDFLESTTLAIRNKGFALVALSGGSTPLTLFTRLTQTPYRDSVPWQQIHFFWVDERCVPADDPQSNYGQVKHTLLMHVPVTPRRIHPVNGNLQPAAAAALYESELQIFIEEEQEWPQFDWVLLGMGSDGHTASLFPGQDNPHENDSAVIAVTAHYQDRPANRVSLTPPVINNAARIVFLVTGASKATTLNKVLHGSYQPLNLPAQRIEPWNGTLAWLVDSAAAEQLPEK